MRLETDLERGFARVRCDHCKHEYLPAFSCKGRWFCPSCQQKKVQLFGWIGLQVNQPFRLTVGSHAASIKLLQRG